MLYVIQKHSELENQSNLGGEWRNQKHNTNLVSEDSNIKFKITSSSLTKTESFRINKLLLEDLKDIYNLKGFKANQFNLANRANSTNRASKSKKLVLNNCENFYNELKSHSEFSHHLKPTNGGVRKILG